MKRNETKEKNKTIPAGVAVNDCADIAAGSERL